MAEPPDLASLARRYLDLWQEQLAAVAADPDLAEAFARFWGAFLPARRGGDELAEAATAWSSAAAAASGERGGRLDELARRLAALEDRLAALEAGTRRRRARASGKPRRRRR